MFALQIRQAAEATPLPPQRRSRGPWSPSSAGPYVLPRDVANRLATALADYRNREAAFALAVFLARFWSAPKRLVTAFPIDRRALADHAVLGLTEARVRGAIAVLEAVGFLERAIPPRGSLYKATETGLHRKPIAFRFGADYGTAFAQANRRTRAGRGSPSPARRPIVPSSSPRPEQPRPQVAQKEIPAERGVLMGDRPLSSSALEEALARLGRAVGG